MIFHESDNWTILLVISNNCFKYAPKWMVSSLIFQKFSGEGLTEPPPQTPPPLFLGLRPRFGLRPQFSGASRPRLGLRPRYSGASRPRFGLRPQLSIGDLGLAPQNKFLDPPLNRFTRFAHNHKHTHNDELCAAINYYERTGDQCVHNRVVHGSLFLDLTRPTRPDPRFLTKILTRPATRPFPYMYSLQFNNYLLIK